MNTSNSTEQLAYDIFQYYKDLGRERHFLTKNQIFKVFNLNSKNSNEVFETAIKLGVKFSKEIPKKSISSVTKNPLQEEDLINNLKEKAINHLKGAFKVPPKPKPMPFSVPPPKYKNNTLVEIEDEIEF